MRNLGLSLYKEALKKFEPYDHFGFLTNRVARLLSNKMQAVLQSNGFDFPVSCIGVLADLWQKDGILQKDLGTSLIKTKSSVNKMLHTLEINGLIQKVEDKSDLRKKYIFLTDRGLKMRSMVDGEMNDFQNNLIEKFTAEEISITKNVLASMYIQLSTTQNKAL